MTINIPEWLLWNNPHFPDTKAVNIIDHKDGECIVYVFNKDGNVHFAVTFDDEQVIAFEHTPENYPATSVAFYASKKMWRKAVKDVEWIVAGLKEGCLGFSGCELDEV